MDRFYELRSTGYLLGSSTPCYYLIAHILDVKYFIAAGYTAAQEADDHSIATHTQKDTGKRRQGMI